MRAGFYQFKPVFGDVSKNLERITRALDGVNAELIVLPELAFTGYFFRDREEVKMLSETVSKSATLETMHALCKSNKFYIVTGFAEKDKERLFNSAILIGPEGIVHTYRKLHLFNDEKEWFDQGDIELSVQTVMDTCIGMMVCFDWIFPEVSRCLALLGADIICHPSNLVLDYCQKAMATRSLENNVYSITANRYGLESNEHGSMRFTGQSQICAPRGEIIIKAPSQKEMIYITRLDQAVSQNKFITSQNHVFNDRRPDYYSGINKR